MQIFPMEIYGEISMEIDVLILHGIPWRFFTRVESTCTSSALHRPHSNYVSTFISTRFHYSEAIYHHISFVFPPPHFYCHCSLSTSFSTFRPPLPPPQQHFYCFFLHHHHNFNCFFLYNHHFTLN